MGSPATPIDEILARQPPLPTLQFAIHGVAFEVRCGIPAVADELRGIYGRHAVAAHSHPGYRVAIVDGVLPGIPADLDDYVLPNGKVKERYRDDGPVRWVTKRNTGLQTLFDDRRYVLGGNVTENVNQVINIINAIYMKDMDQRGFLICQAAGLEVAGEVVCIAGRSGAGKTTTLLKLIAQGGRYVSNDRLLVRRAAESAASYEMWGIPKWPRVNAGTMMGDATLQALLPSSARDRYAAMSYDALFELEEKYDVDVGAVYGSDRVRDGGRFRRIYYLMWRRDGDGFAIEQPDLSDPTFWADLGPNLYRDAGVYDRRNHRSLWNATIEERYRDTLMGASIHAIHGRVDFEAIGEAIASHMKET